MASTELAASELSWRRLGLDDLAAAQAFSREAGWNQTADDWQAMIAAGEGLAVCAGDAVVASGLTLPYGDRFGWIAMILVTAAQRRRGIATALLRRCMAACARRGIVAGLDATEAGRQVYLPLGFRDVYGLSRMIADRPSGAVPDGVRPMTIADLPAVAAYDRTVFGADRTPVLAHLLQRWPEAAWVAVHNEAASRPTSPQTPLLPEGRRGTDPRSTLRPLSSLKGGEGRGQVGAGDVRGFCLGRDGRTAHQIGPLSAADAPTAMALLQAALAAVPGPVLIDAADHQPAFRRALDAAGFTRQRGYVRMLLDRSAPLDKPVEVYAIAGPEIG